MHRLLAIRYTMQWRRTAPNARWQWNLPLCVGACHHCAGCRCPFAVYIQKHLDIQDEGSYTEIAISQLHPEVVEAFSDESKVQEWCLELEQIYNRWGGLALVHAVHAAGDVGRQQA